MKFPFFPLVRSCLWALGIFLVPLPLCAQTGQPVPASPPALAPRFRVEVEGKKIPVSSARVCSLSAVERRPHQGLPKPEGTAGADFVSFDWNGPVRVTVSCPENVQSATVLPSSLGISPTVEGGTVTFTVPRPTQLTLEINGDWIRSLHLFADPPEEAAPRPDDPGVIYFGPGEHEVQGLEVPSGKTVYLARGAVVYGVEGGDHPKIPVFYLHGSDITLRGRGIIDASRCGRGTRSIVGVTGTNIRVEGVTLRDSGGFTLPIRRSEKVRIENVKIFGWRGNSDGMDICNSRSVTVSNCFLRTFDDLIVLKTDKGQGELKDVEVSGCVLWNEFAHALSLGAELREPLSDIVFRDCDVIRDRGREWLLRVFNCDSAPVKNVLFDDIRIEEAWRLMSVWIGKTVWSKEEERGHIEQVVFRNIRAAAPSHPGPISALIGFDAEHRVDDVGFENVTVAGRPLKISDVECNPFAEPPHVTP